MKSPSALILAVPMALAACGSGGPNSVSGQFGFSSIWAGSNVVPRSGFAPEILLVIEADTDLGQACNDALDAGIFTPPGPVKSLLNLGLASLTGSVVLGDYAILPLSATTLPPNAFSIAFLERSTYNPPGDPTSVASAVSGTVTLTAFDAHNQKGSFDVTMELPDGGPAGKLTGTFDATPCGPQG